MKQIFILLLTLTFCSTSIWSQKNDVRSFSLVEAASYAVNNNIDVKNALVDIADADARVVEAKSFGIPQANFKMDYSRFIKLPVTVLPEEFGLDPATGMPNPNFDNEVAFGVKNSFNAKLEVSSLLFDGSYLVGLQAAKLYTNQSKLQLEQVKDEVMSSVRDAYLPALVVEENKKILNKNLESIEQLLFETKELYKAGFAEQLDIDRLELTKANLMAEVENLDDQYQLATNYLKFQMGYPVHQEIRLSDDLNALLKIPSDNDLNGPVNYGERSDYTVVQSAVTLNELNVKRFKAGYLPQLLAFGSYGVLRQGNRISEGAWSDNAVVGLQLNVPIFDGFDKKAKVQRASLQLEMVKNRKTQLEQAIELQVKTARTQYLNAMNRLEDRSKNLTLAEKIYNTTRIKYKEGVGSSLEISQAEQSLYQSQSNYINAKYDVLVAKINLDKALGK